MDIIPLPGAICCRAETQDRGEGGCQQLIPLESPDQAHSSVKQVAKLLMQFYKQRQQAALQTATTSHDADESMATPNEQICALLGVDKVEFAEIKGTVKLPIHQAAAVVLAAVKRKRLNAAETEATPDEGIPEAKRMSSVALGTPCSKTKKKCATRLRRGPATLMKSLPQKG